MRAARPVLALGLVAALSAVGVADAATKPKPKPVPPVCKLVTDKAGDGTGFLLTDRDYVPNDGNLDLVSGDVASDGKIITAVVRTATLALSDPAAPTGRAYYANFEVAGKMLYLQASLDQAGAATYGAGFVETRRTALPGTVKGVVDVARKEIRISAPVGIFAMQASLKPGTRVTNLNLLAQRFIGASAVGGATPSADLAEGGKAYTVGVRSCVVPGK